MSFAFFCFPRNMVSRRFDLMILASRFFTARQSKLWPPLKKSRPLRKFRALFQRNDPFWATLSLHTPPDSSRFPLPAPTCCSWDNNKRQLDDHNRHHIPVRHYRLFRQRQSLLFHRVLRSRNLCPVMLMDGDHWDGERVDRLRLFLKEFEELVEVP